MNVRKSNKKDTKYIATLLKDYWKERGMRYSQGWAEDYVKNGHKKEIKKEISFILMDKMQIGYISTIIYEGNVAELRDLVVKKEFRNKGYGRLLAEKAITWCRKNRIRKMYALAFPKNEAFYKRLGFRREGLLKDHFKKGEDLLFVSRFIK